MPENMTREGVAAGKSQISAEGGNRVVYEQLLLGTYDPDGDGTGNNLDPNHAFGLSRVLKMNIDVADGSAYYARYDYGEEAVRLFNEDGTGEVAGATEVNVPLRVEARGMGP